MASYSVFLTQSAAKELEGIPSEVDRRRIANQIRGLAENPRPSGSITLAGRRDRLRLRQGDYRIVYSVDDTDSSVTVFRIAHRREVYRHHP